MTQEEMKIDLEKIDQKFLMQEESDELLGKARAARSAKKAIEFAKKALQVWPENIDAERFLIEFEDDELVMIQKTKDLIAREEASLKKQRIYTKESVGHFWGIIETRPLMRLKNDLARMFLEMNKRKEAIAVYEEMLKLCPNDNIGVRFLLLGQYVFFEEYEKAERLSKKYGDVVSTFMSLPMVVCYYKQDNYQKAKSIWKNMTTRNKHMVRFITQQISDEELEALEDAHCYQLGSLEEAYMAYRDNIHLLTANPSFLEWLTEHVLVK